MSYRTTRANVEYMFDQLCETLGKSQMRWDVLTGHRIVGAWRLDYVACYGGYVIEEIYNEHGAVSHPLGDVRMGPAEFVRAARFALEALGIAAAPELLAALKETTATLRAYLDSIEDGKDDDAESAYQHGVAMISKTEGRE